MKCFVTSLEKINEFFPQASGDVDMPDFIQRDIDRTIIAGESFKEHDAYLEKHSSESSLTSHEILSSDNSDVVSESPRPKSAAFEFDEELSEGMGSHSSDDFVLSVHKDFEAKSISQSSQELRSLEENLNREETQKFLLSHIDQANYVQGTLTGKVVEGLILIDLNAQRASSSSEKQKNEIDTQLQNLQYNLQGVDFLFKDDNGQIKGVNIKINLETKEWYAVIRDFSDSPKLVILGAGKEFEVLNRMLKGTKVEKPTDMINNKELNEKLGLLDQKLTKIKLQQQNNVVTLTKEQVFDNCSMLFILPKQPLDKQNIKYKMSPAEKQLEPEPDQNRKKSFVSKYFGRFKRR